MSTPIATHWAVNNMTRMISDGGVIVADWSCTASATGVQGAFYGGKSTFAAPDPNAPGFIPYDQLTQNDILGWVWAGMQDGGKADIEATLMAKVEKQINPTTEQGVPWNNDPAA